MASNTDQQLLVAIELLRRTIANVPLATGMNANRATEPKFKMPALSYNADGTGGFAIPGTRGNPLPIPRAQADPASLLDKVGTSANWLVTKGMQPLGAASAALGSVFGKMLGPMAQLATYATSAGSGFQLLQGAMGMFANTVGAVLQPVTFALSIGFTAASRKIAAELMPSLDKFTKLVLSTALPAMASLANLAGKAAGALELIANNRLSRAVGDTRGGMAGALDRTIDRLTGETPQGVQSSGGTMGWAKGAHRTVDDFAASYFGVVGSGLANAKNWSMKQLLGADADPYSGSGTIGDGGKSKKEILEAARLNVAEMQFRQSSAGNGVGDVRGNWARAQNATLTMSPFEQENLKLLREQLQKDQQILAQLEREGAGQQGAYTQPAPDPARNTGLLSTTMRRAKGG